MSCAMVSQGGLPVPGEAHDLYCRSTAQCLTSVKRAAPCQLSCMAGTSEAQDEGDTWWAPCAGGLPGVATAGFLYAQNAAPGGPVAWILTDMVDRVRRTFAALPNNDACVLRLCNML